MINQDTTLTPDGCLSLATLVELREAIVSLYRDQIRPTQPDISRRLIEMGFRGVTLGELMELACESESEFVVVVDETLQISMEFHNSPSWFSGWIDPVDSQLRYSVEIWDLLNHFVLHAIPSQVKGGRYGLAKRLYEECLKSRECPECELFRFEISKFTIGRLSHLIQLGIHRGIFRYEDNLLKLSACCTIPSAALAAKLIGSSTFPRTLPKGGAAIITREVDTLDELKEYLYTLLKTTTSLPLSQLKKKLIDEFQVVLNPIKFGFIKLSDLLEVFEEFFLIQKSESYFITLK